MSPRPKRKETPAEPLPLPEELRVISIQVKNVLGIEERALDPEGRAVLVSGPNATGKSSLLKAVQAGLGGGSLAKLARIGSEDDPEVVLVLAGAGEEYRVEKHGGDTARVLRRVGDSQAFTDVPRPQEFLSGLFDARLASPVAWLLAKPQDQQALFLEALPLELDEQALQDALADVSAHLEPVPRGLHALEHVGLVHDQLFKARTGVNRDARQKRESADQIRRQLPAEGPEGVEDAIKAAEAEVSEASNRLARRRQEIEAAEREAVLAAESERRRKMGELEAEYERRKREIEAAFHEAEEAAARARVVAHDSMAADKEAHQAAREKLAGLRSQAEDAVRFRALDEQAAGFERDAERHAAEAQRLTAALDRLDAFREKLASDLPIPGVTFEDGEIKVDGVPLPQVNTANQVIVAARVAAERAKRNPLKVLFLDGLQELDSAHRDALLKLLARKGVQTFGAVVADGPPGIHYVGAVTS